MKRTILLMFTFPVMLQAWAYNFIVDGIYYNINADKSTVSVTTISDHGTIVGGAYSGDVIVPEYVEYNNNKYLVNAVGPHAFNACYSLNSVELPNTITSIGALAFKRCSLKAIPS